MAKKNTLTKREKEKVKKELLRRRAELFDELYGMGSETEKSKDFKADDLDRAVEAGTMELRVTLSDTERRELEDILLALERLENGTYGTCEACLEEPRHVCPTCPQIVKQRLFALPAARLCVSCREVEEENPTHSHTPLHLRRAIWGEDVKEFSHPLLDSSDED